MYTIKSYLFPEHLEEAYELLCRDPRNSAVLGGCCWLKMGRRRIRTAIDLTRLGLDQVIAIGEKARLMAQGAGNIALHFDTVEQAMPAVREALTPGTAMLVKASHAMEFHRIVEALAQEA